MHTPNKIKTILLIITALYVGSLHAAPAFIERASAAKAHLLDSHWTSYQDDSPKTIDHSIWDKILGEYVVVRSGLINLFSYAAVTEEQKKQIRSYIDSLSNIAIAQYDNTEQQAYWLNLYNALTVLTVLEHYPVASIKKINISPGIFSKGPWGKPQVRVDGRELSLNNIEHGIIRPVYKDPRSHYGVNCAALGCPQLQTRAFTGANLNTLLDQAASDYINGPGVSIRRGKLAASKIYNWFGEDFGTGAQEVVSHIRKYARGDLKKALENIDSIKSYYYDWTLNDAALWE